eukprot:scaffold296568_cov21-Tisochrysis_lutea.AAC.2
MSKSCWETNQLALRKHPTVSEMMNSESHQQEETRSNRKFSTDLVGCQLCVQACPLSSPSNTLPSYSFKSDGMLD